MIPYDVRGFHLFGAPGVHKPHLPTNTCTGSQLFVVILYPVASAVHDKEELLIRTKFWLLGAPGLCVARRKRVCHMPHLVAGICADS